MKNISTASFVTIIPLHNEAKITVKLCHSIENFLRENPEFKFILALDNCTDDTEVQLTKIVKNKNILIIKSDRQPGYGNVIRFAHNKAYELGYQWGIVIDSDLSNPLREVIKIGEIISSNTDTKVVIIKGNRFHKIRADFVDVPLKRVLFSQTANIFTKIFAGKYSQDLTNGFRAVNIPWVNKYRFNESGFSSIVEEAYVAIANGYRILDFNTTLRYDEAIRTESSFSFKPKLLLSYSKYIFKIWLLIIKHK